jgi:hypothetical protein
MQPEPNHKVKKIGLKLKTKNSQEKPAFLCSPSAAEEPGCCGSSSATNRFVINPLEDVLQRAQLAKTKKDKDGFSPKWHTIDRL